MCCNKLQVSGVNVRWRVCTKTASSECIQFTSVLLLLASLTQFDATLVFHWELNRFMACNTSWEPRPAVQTREFHHTVHPADTNICNIKPQTPQSVTKKKKIMLGSHVFSKFKRCYIFIGLQHAEFVPAGLGTKRTFLHGCAWCTLASKSCCTEALHLNPNTVLHSDSESSCQGI